MDIKNISSKEFISLPIKEQEAILQELEHSNCKYNELKTVRKLTKMREKQKQIKYDICMYDGSLNNIKNRLYILGHNEGYKIFLTEEKLNGIEKYGFIQLIINFIKLNKSFDIYAIFIQNVIFLEIIYKYTIATNV